MEISYRPAVESDYDFLYDLHRRAMREYVEDTFGVWDESWQQSYFRQGFHPELLQVIQMDRVDVGVLQVQDRTEELFIANVEILPEYQRRGIGTQVIRSVLETAERSGRPVALRVLKVNRRARDLYQRLGFGVTGENVTHYLMVYGKI